MVVRKQRKISELQQLRAVSLSKTFIIAELIFLILICFRPISGLHSFRQAQTNWPVKNWSLEGFSPFNPKVPIKGLESQSWLLEFPLFQWVTFVIHKIFILPIDASSRITALICATSICYTISKVIERNFQIKWRYSFLIISVNPFFFYWATTGLCDWMAILLGVIAAKILTELISKPLQSKWRKILAPFWILCLAGGFLIKPIQALLGFIFVLVLTYCKRELWTADLVTKVFVGVLFSSTAYLSWSKWTGSLYPLSDPRNIWKMNNQNLNWYFGSKEQYANVGNNAQYIFDRYVGSSYGFLLFVSMLLFATTSRKKANLVTLLTLISALYLLVFVNLNS